MTNSILLIENDPGQAELTQIAFEEGNSERQVCWVKTGEEALDYLFQRGAHRGAARPSLIVLDLHLPGMSGIEVLKKIKEAPELRAIPVVMFTTSDDQEAARTCYALGASSFVTKSVIWDEFMTTVQLMKQYWLVIQRIPSLERVNTSLRKDPAHR